MKRTLRVVICMILCLSALNAAEASIRVGVVNFTNKSDSSKIAAEWLQQASDIMAKLLSASESIEVLNRNDLGRAARNAALSTGSNESGAVAGGRSAGCQYILLGSVVNIVSKEWYKSHSGFLFFDYRFEQKLESAVTVDVRLIEVASGKVALSLARDGVGRYLNSGDERRNLAADKGDDVNYLNFISAVSGASAQIAAHIREIIGNEFACVDSISKKKIYINRGSRSGIESDDIFYVFADGDEIRDLNGASLGRDTIGLVLAVVGDVKEDECSAEVIKGSLDAVREGDRVKLLSVSEADKLAERGSFPKLRPASAHERKKKDVFAVKRTDLENESLDPAKVIACYGLPAGEANTRRIAHINASRLKDKKQAYEKFSELLESYAGDYLAAYRAAEAALAMNDAANAKRLTDTALSVNPNYKPALQLRKKISG